MATIAQKTVFYVSNIEWLPCQICFVSQSCFVFGSDTKRHGNEGAQQIGEHRLGNQSKCYTLSQKMAKFGRPKILLKYEDIRPANFFCLWMWRKKEAKKPNSTPKGPQANAGTPLGSMPVPPKNRGILILRTHVSSSWGMGPGVVALATRRIRAK